MGMFESAAQSLAAIRANPLRSFLGALAIVAAVATIVMVVTALDGVRRYTEATTARTFGSDTFLVAQVASPGRVPRRVLREQLLRNPPLTRTDLAYLDRYDDAIVQYAPNAQVRADVSRGNRRLDDAAITGTTSALADIRDVNVVEGRFIAADEDRSGAAVAVIGADVIDALFSGETAIGQTIRIAGRGFTVIGVQGRIGNAGAGSLDKYVWIPFTAHQRAFGAPRSLQIFGRHRASTPTEAEDHARTTLRARRSLGPSVPDNFDVLAPEAARGFVTNLSQRVGAAAAPISLMALLAAIVVVTNTVLVSVSQRTREIGVRRALGARRADILREVLIEATLLAVAGGVAGVAVAMLLLAAARAALPIPLVVAPATVVAALLAAAGSGIAAGWYPALRAARMDVITALRSE
jgi:putative ABC transport system permease protein